MGFNVDDTKPFHRNNIERTDFGSNDFEVTDFEVTISKNSIFSDKYSELFAQIYDLNKFWNTYILLACKIAHLFIKFLF